MFADIQNTKTLYYTVVTDVCINVGHSDLLKI
jgi:hypothetical protein